MLSVICDSNIFGGIISLCNISWKPGFCCISSVFISLYVNERFKHSCGQLKIFLFTNFSDCDEDVTLTCQICQQIFSDRHNLSIHIQTHAGDGIERFPCPICQKMFTRKFNMEVHLQIHSGEKPYQCEICQKRFNRKGNLKTHMIVHANSPIV